MHEGVPHTLTPHERFQEFIKTRHEENKEYYGRMAATLMKNKKKYGDKKPSFLGVDAKRTAAAAKAEKEPTTFVTDKLRRKKPTEAPKPVDARRKKVGAVLPPPVPAPKAEASSPRVGFSPRHVRRSEKKPKETEL